MNRPRTQPRVQEVDDNDAGEGNGSYQQPEAVGEDEGSTDSGRNNEPITRRQAAAGLSDTGIVLLIIFMLLLMSAFTPRR